MVLAPWSAHARATLAGLNIATAIASLASSCAVVACGIVAPGFTKGTYAYVKRLAACDGYVYLRAYASRMRASSPCAPCADACVPLLVFL